MKKSRSLLIGFVGALILSMLVWKRLKRSDRGPQEVDSLQKMVAKNLGPYKELAPYVTAQARHETGNLTSNLYLEANNLFGMKQPKIRQTKSIGETQASEGQFATFKSPEESVQDLALYFDYFNYPKRFNSLVDYVNFLKKKGYMEAPIHIYYNALKRWLDA